MDYYTDETTDNIQTGLLSNVSDDYDKDVGFPMYDTLKAFAIALADVYKELSTVRSNMEDVDNLIGDDLARFVEQRKGLTRKVGIYATTQLTVNGIGTIHAGDKFETASGIQYACIQDTVISGTGTIPIQALQIGTYGNTPANTIVQIPITIAGITSCTNLNIVTGGTDDESNDSLRERYYTALKNPITSNNENAFINWAESISGVGKAKAFGCWNGKNTVKVIICNANMQVADQTLINTVQNAIDPKGTQDVSGNWSTWGVGKGLASMGSYATIESASAKNIDITATVVLDTNYTIDEVKQNISNYIIGYLQSIALDKENNYVSYAKVGNLIFNAAGIQDYSNLQINGATSNIILPLTATDCEIPVLGTVILNV